MYTVLYYPRQGLGRKQNNNIPVHMSSAEIYSPKESSFELTIVGPLGLNGFLHLGLLFGFFHPCEPCKLFSGWVVVVGRITFWYFAPC